MCKKSAVSTPLRGERECLQAQVRAAAGGSAAVLQCLDICRSQDKCIQTQTSAVLQCCTPATRILENSHFSAPG